MHVYLGLDVGSQRVGVAVGDAVGRISQPLGAINADNIAKLADYINDYAITDIVVGYPRNQSGQPTAQTEAVKTYAKQLTRFGLPIYWQDESVTSVIAEDRLKKRKKPYTKADIDAEAAAILLQDYLESV